MATKLKLDKDIVLKEYDNGESPANLALKWGVHPTTIRRWVRESGRANNKLSHSNQLSMEVKVQLRKILVNTNKDNIDTIISELDKNFLIELRDKEIDKDFPIIILG